MRQRQRYWQRTSKAGERDLLNRWCLSHYWQVAHKGNKNAPAIHHVWPANPITGHVTIFDLHSPITRQHGVRPKWDQLSRIATTAGKRLGAQLCQMCSWRYWSHWAKNKTHLILCLQVPANAHIAAPSVLFWARSGCFYNEEPKLDIVIYIVGLLVVCRRSVILFPKDWKQYRGRRGGFCGTEEKVLQ